MAFWPLCMAWETYFPPPTKPQMRNWPEVSFLQSPALSSMPSLKTHQTWRVSSPQLVFSSSESLLFIEFFQGSLTRSCLHQHLRIFLPKVLQRFSQMCLQPTTSETMKVRHPSHPEMTEPCPPQCALCKAPASLSLRRHWAC